KLPRTTLEQANRGKQIARSDLQRGDLIFFRTGPGSRHVGIYLGDGQFMHASETHGVTKSSIDSAYWRRHYWQSRRLPTQLDPSSPRSDSLRVVINLYDKQSRKNDHAASSSPRHSSGM